MNANSLVSEIIEYACNNNNNVHSSVKGTSVQHYSNLDLVRNVCHGTKQLKNSKELSRKYHSVVCTLCQCSKFQL